MRKKTLMGIAGSAVWLVLAASVAYWKRDVGAPLALNEIGDFIGGVFSPLALWWLILGYFQQGEELAQNTAALTAQADQLKQAVKEYEELNETNKRNADLLQKQYDETRKPSILVKNCHPPSYDYVMATSYCMVEMVNVGAIATNFAVKIDHEDIVAEVPRYAYANTGEDFEFRLCIPSFRKIDKEVPIYCNVKYQSMDGRTFQNTFVLDLFEFGSERGTYIALTDIRNLETKSSTIP